MVVWRAMVIWASAVAVVAWCGSGEQGIEPHIAHRYKFIDGHNNIILYYRRGTRKVPRFLLRERDGGGSHNGRVVSVASLPTHRRAAIGVCSATAQLSIKCNPAINLFRTRIKSNSIRFHRIGIRRRNDLYTTIILIFSSTFKRAQRV